MVNALRGVEKVSLPFERSRQVRNCYRGACLRHFLFVHGMERADATFVFCETSAAILRFLRVQLNTYFQYNINTSITTITISKVCVTFLADAVANGRPSADKLRHIIGRDRPL